MSMNEKMNFKSFLKRSFVAHPMLFGAPIGVVVIALVEAVAIFIRLSLFPSSSFAIFAYGIESLFLIAGATKAICIGIPAGSSCGGAIREWLLNNREGCREICRATARYIIFASLFFSAPTFYFHFVLSSGQTFWNYLLAPIYFSTFSLQLGLAMLFLSRWLPLNSEDTVQVTENLRL
ncbi:hypothetical protein EON80_00185 [bacterium]|nr:MAG: hypothetical protein EON80_00185 [bacterium]